MRTPPPDASCVYRKPQKGSAQGHLIPASLHGILDSFSDCFSRPSFENFVAFVSGWIACQGRHCISRVIQVAGGDAAEKHFAALYRFLSRSKWSPDDLGRVLFRLLLRWSPDTIEVLVDDTLCQHGGARIFGAAMHRDPLASGYGRGLGKKASTFFACGHSWVVIAMRIPLPWNTHRGIAVPFLFRLYRSKKRCPEKYYRKRTELARDLIMLLYSWIPDETHLTVAGDREYASKTVVRDLPARITFIGSAVMNAVLYSEPPKYAGRGRPRKIGERLASPAGMAADKCLPWQTVSVQIYGRTVALRVKTKVCLWYTVAGARLVKIVVTNDPKKRYANRSFFSTDAESTTEEIVESFARRWLIETCFRDAKQFMGIADPQNGWSRGQATHRTKHQPGPRPRGNRGSLAVENTAPIGFISQAIVIIWYLENGDAQKDVRRARIQSPWSTRKRQPSFRDMLVAIRREIWSLRLFGYPAKTRGRPKSRAMLPDAMFAA